MPVSSEGYRNQEETRYRTVGDTRTGEFFQLLQGPTPVDLTSATVKFHMVDADSNDVKVDEQAAVVVDATEGTVRYDWADADVDTAGTYNVFLIVVEGGKRDTFPHDGPMRKIEFVAKPAGT